MSAASRTLAEQRRLARMYAAALKKWHDDEENYDANFAEVNRAARELADYAVIRLLGCDALLATSEATKRRGEALLARSTTV